MSCYSKDPAAWAAFKAGWRMCVEAHRAAKRLASGEGNPPIWLHASYWKWIGSEEYKELAERSSKVERRLEKPSVGGASPSVPTILVGSPGAYDDYWKFHR